MWLRLLCVVTIAVFASAGLNPKRFYKQQPNEYVEFQDNEEILGAPFVDPFVDPTDGISYRLPNDTVPLRYNIWLSTDIHAGNFSFEGRVRIQIQAVANTPNITLHYRELTINSVTLLDANENTIQSNVPYIRRPVEEFMDIQPAQPLINGTIYWVDISYNGILRNDDAGFYRSSYLNPAGERIWLATTQFESTDARHAFPW